MSVALSVLILVVVLGVLITAHELGHYFMARLTGVAVNEFAIGMGPAIWSRRKKDAEGNRTGTKFSLRVFPIGGFCAMEGEDESSSNPHAFNNRPRWARALVLVAGSLMNFLVGLLILLVLLGTTVGKDVATARIGSLMAGFPLEGEQGLMAGDQILRIDGQPVYTQMDVSLLMSRRSGGSFDFVVRRDGKRVEVSLPLEKREYGAETYDIVIYTPQGVETTPAYSEGGRYYGFRFAFERVTLLTAVKNAWLQGIDYVRLVWMSLGDLVTGRAGLDELMGPIGMGAQINEVVSDPDPNVTPWWRAATILNMAALIAVNLAVMNLLPLPALDGARILFVGLEAVRRKPVNPRIEGVIHMAGMVLLIGLMIFAAFNDVIRQVLKL